MRGERPTARKQARNDGLERYLGRTCRKCGSKEKYTKLGRCVNCALSDNKAFLLSYHLRFPEKYILKNAKTRAKKRNMEFSITEKDIHIPEFCPDWHIKLGQVRGHRTDDTPTLDRIDNSKGYIPGNVRVVSWIANRTKGEMTMCIIERMYNNMREALSKQPIN
jgi:hypothetical protein